VADEYQQKFSEIPLPSPESLLPSHTERPITSQYDNNQPKYKKATSSIPRARKPLTSRTALKKQPKQETQQTKETQRVLHETQQSKEMQQTHETEHLKDMPQTQETQIPQENQTKDTPQLLGPQTQQNENRKLRIFVSFFELLGKNAFDLLADKNPISILEDKFGEIQLAGIVERQVSQIK
jgi:hypothetical protein